MFATLRTPDQEGTESSAHVIEVEGLRKTYSDSVAIEDISFTVARGEVFGLLGPNGAGKTTTVECLQGLRRRDAGRVRVLGIDPASRTSDLRRRCGSQLQSSYLPDRLRVGEALKLFASSQQQTVPLDQLVARWELEELWRRPFAKLSGGQRQRLFIALALINHPEIVFFDELTTGLDPQARRATWDLVKEIQSEGVTVVLVTHFMEEAEELCDRVAVIDRGRIVADGTPHELIHRAGVAMRVSFSWSDPDIGALTRLAGVQNVIREGETVHVTGAGPLAVTVAGALVQRGIAPIDFRTHYPNLEDVFLALTGRDLRE
jgi:ABC-2 type transport system ATP-binding protein